MDPEVFSVDMQFCRFEGPSYPILVFLHGYLSKACRISGWQRLGYTGKVTC